MSSNSYSMKSLNWLYATQAAGKYLSFYPAMTHTAVNTYYLTST